MSDDVMKSCDAMFDFIACTRPVGHALTTIDAARHIGFSARQQIDNQL